MVLKITDLPRLLGIGRPHPAAAIDNARHPIRDAEVGAVITSPHFHGGAITTNWDTKVSAEFDAARESINALPILTIHIAANPSTNQPERTYYGFAIDKFSMGPQHMSKTDSNHVHFDECFAIQKPNFFRSEIDRQFLRVLSETGHAIPTIMVAGDLVNDPTLQPGTIMPRMEFAAFKTREEAQSYQDAFNQTRSLTLLKSHVTDSMKEYQSTLGAQVDLNWIERIGNQRIVEYTSTPKGQTPEIKRFYSLVQDVHSPGFESDEPLTFRRKYEHGKRVEGTIVDQMSPTDAVLREACISLGLEPPVIFATFNKKNEFIGTTYDFSSARAASDFQQQLCHLPAISAAIQHLDHAAAIEANAEAEPLVDGSTINHVEHTRLRSSAQGTERLQ